MKMLAVGDFKLSLEFFTSVDAKAAHDSELNWPDYIGCPTAISQITPPPRGLTLVTCSPLRKCPS